jgi:hypothetical protein
MHIERKFLQAKKAFSPINSTQLGESKTTAAIHHLLKVSPAIHLFVLGMYTSSKDLRSLKSTVGGET